jgi:peptidoglycan/xylan/chitin deacetylase (PgdA/CDA1 family)
LTFRAAILLIFGPDSRAENVLPVPDKLIVLTFADGLETHATVYAPVLKRYGFGATFFLTESLGFTKGNERTPFRFMTWEQIRKLHKDAFEIGNHSGQHKMADNLSSGANSPVEIRHGFD